jgi:alkanesulfonate monooxygenase SsuD/methylene tetrahydromethanopterin reductase-like flavin-dependent oxidoreductase (luciferase family)
VVSDGPYYQLPSPIGTGLGKPLRSVVHPFRADLPILIGAYGPKNIALSAEIGDGLLAANYSVRHEDLYRQSLQEGWNRPGARRGPDDFEVIALVRVVVDDDIEAAADQVRPQLAFAIGGMGARGANFNFDAFVRLGYEEEATKIQHCFLDGRVDEAVSLVSTDMVSEVALVGPVERIRDELQLWEGSLVTTLMANSDRQGLRVMAELLS